MYCSHVWSSKTAGISLSYLADSRVLLAVSTPYSDSYQMSCLVDKAVGQGGSRGVDWETELVMKSLPSKMRITIASRTQSRTSLRVSFVLPW